jgi:hypothetical protein
MFRILFSLIFFLISYTIYSQPLESISAQLLDAESKAPVAFAHIQVLGKVFVTNQSGKFAINYNRNALDAKVEISCVGYRSISTSIDAIASENTLLINPDDKILPELVVAELSAKKILKKVEDKGFKNYRTKPYLGKYSIEQFVYYDNDTSILAVARDSGRFINQGLDTLGVFPSYNRFSRTFSSDFLLYDTFPTILSGISNQRNHISFETLYSFDPINIGLLKKNHPLPTMFSDGFYNNTDQRIIAMVPITGVDHYLIAVYPKVLKAEDNLKLKNEIDAQTLKMYHEKLKELSKMTGKNFTDHAIDSMIANNLMKNKSSSAVLGFFLINAEDFSVSHAVIKVNTFDAAGKPYSKLHVSASYEYINKKYYLKNLDVIVKRTPPASVSDERLLYYYFSLMVSDIEMMKGKPVLPSEKVVNRKNDYILEDDKWPQHPLIRNNYFLQPIMNCGTCPINPITYLNGTF